MAKKFGKFLLFTAAVGTAAAAAYYYMQQKDSQLKESSDADDDYDEAKAIFSALGSYENSFHFSSFILDTPYVFVCPPENKKSSGTSSISPRTRGSAALPFMRKISHPSLFFG